MKHLTYLKRVRRSHDLTQRDLAQLMGIHQANLSRLERGQTPPDLEAAFILQIIFNANLRHLFPSLHGAVEDAVMRRAADFDRYLAKQRKRASARKQALLSAMALRASAGAREV